MYLHPVSIHAFSPLSFSCPGLRSTWGLCWKQVALPYFATFVRTMRREWFGIDRQRLDKFMMLVRRFVRALLARLRAARWAVAEAQPYLALIRDEVLLPSDTLLAIGVAYHVSDVWLPELQAAAAGGGGRPPHASLVALLEPFAEALARTRQQALLSRVM